MAHHWVVALGLRVLGGSHGAFGSVSVPEVGGVSWFFNASAMAFALMAAPVALT
jgi:hypothetical protein